MNDNKNEKNIINIITYLPITIMLIIIFLGLTFLFNENKKTFDLQKKEIEENYIKENKLKIKEEIDRTHIWIMNKYYNNERKLKENIKERVYEAHSIATSIYKIFKDKKTNEEILFIIKSVLGELRFNEGRGYIFMDDINGVKILQPIDKSKEGKKYTKLVNPDEYQLFFNIIETIKQKSERYDRYYWYKPDSPNEKAEKITFYKYFAPFNMVIGTGEYLEDFNNELKKEVLDSISSFRYSKFGYIFILNYDGIYLSHLDKNLINIDTKYDSSTNVNTIEKIIELGKHGSGYLTYFQKKKPNTNKSSSKTSYIRSIEPWKWIIGTGFYDDDMQSYINKKKIEIDSRFEEYTYKLIVASFILAILLLLFTTYVTRHLKIMFTNYKVNLNKTQTMLSQQAKMAAMGEMIGNIAHQWRQPLSVITTSATGMKLHKELGNFDDELFGLAVDKINNSAQYLSKIIDDFRNFFSPTKRKIEFNIKNTFNNTLELISAQFTAKQIRIIKNISEINLYTYENELIQSLINILNNARDELIKLPEDTDRLIFIDAYEKDNKLIIKIKDNAGGIPENIIDKIFEPYFSTKKETNGTGIGLYMTEEIVSKHLVGNISACNVNYVFEDIPYNGAEFTIELNLESTS